LPLSGTLWIDPQKWRNCKIGSASRFELNDLGLSGMRSEVRYAPTHFTVPMRPCGFGVGPDRSRDARTSTGATSIASRITQRFNVGIHEEIGQPNEYKTDESIRNRTFRHFQRGDFWKKAPPAPNRRLDCIHGIRRRIRYIWIRLLHASANERPFRPARSVAAERPIGVNLGIFGVLLFFLDISLPTTQGNGLARTAGQFPAWLDFHVIMGTAAPLVIALHSSFKFRGHSW